MKEKYNLTNREYEVLILLVQGYSNPDIAKILNITVHTVKAHISSMYEKTGLNSRVNLAVRACKYNICEKEKIEI